MLRMGASRLALRSIPAARPIARPVASFRVTPPPVAQWTVRVSSTASKRPQVPVSQLKPIQAAVLRRTLSEERKRAEERSRHEKIKPTPETVSTTSTVRPIFSEVGAAKHEQDVDMGASIKQDIETIGETFNLSDVPRQAYYIGLAGVLPYLATSLSTVACAYEINHAVAGHGLVMSTQTATTLLHILEPLQIGYGAVILSFLGAIHWGLEWAGYGGYQGYKRYAIGVVAPAVAWPTVLMPVEYALVTQFCAFTLLYYVDTRATFRGWTPPWYSIYRFVLTFIVGASIVVSLIGRGEIVSRGHRTPGAADRIKELWETAPETLSREEKAIQVKNESEAAEKDNVGSE